MCFGRHLVDAGGGLVAGVTHLAGQLRLLLGAVQRLADVLARAGGDHGDADGHDAHIADDLAHLLQEFVIGQRQVADLVVGDGRDLA
ncbi:hypothetical protein D3C72_1850710 [compost metagenome]